MRKTYTFDDLILFAYNETGDDKSGEIIEALTENKELFDDYNSILNIKKDLDCIIEEPSETTINNILNYSKAINVFNFKPAVNTGIFIVN